MSSFFLCHQKIMRGIVLTSRCIANTLEFSEITKKCILEICKNCEMQISQFPMSTQKIMLQIMLNQLYYELEFLEINHQ